MVESIKLVAAVFLGGGLGSVLRYIISLAGHRWLSPFPTATLISNILACAFLVTFSMWMSDKEVSQFNKLFLLVGFCGGFSTFSTFSWDTFQLWKNGSIGLAVLNVIVSVVACLLVIYFLQKKLS